MLFGFNPFERPEQREMHDAIVKADFAFPDGYTVSQARPRAPPPRPPGSELVEARASPYRSPAAGWQQGIATPQS